jgi:hypothetical protein
MYALIEISNQMLEDLSLIAWIARQIEAA